MLVVIIRLLDIMCNFARDICRVTFMGELTRTAMGFLAAESVCLGLS